MQRRWILYIFFFCALAAHGLFSVHSRPLQARWVNVPPVPSEAAAIAMALGDRALAYRMYGIMIQNLGDTGGRVTPLKDYDYPRLGQWFMLEDKMDERSDFIPYLAAYYFGGSQEPEDLGPVVDYLSVVGERPYTQKWRWLAQAIHLARFGLGDMDRAMEMAHTLAALDYEKMPAWARQMPAFIAQAQGDKETALAIMLSILQSEGPSMQKAEVNFMIDYICRRTLDEDERQDYEFCAELPP